MIKPVTRVSVSSLEPVFLPDSYGVRPGTSAREAVDVARKRCGQQDGVREFANHLARRYWERTRNFVGQHFWARGYFVSTVGRDDEVIRQSIRNQENEDQRREQLNLWR